MKREGWTLEQGVEACRVIQAAVQPLGFHVGLAGSVLTKGSSTKDLDVIVYPHNRTERPPVEEVHDALREIGVKLTWDRKFIDEIRVKKGSTDTKHVEAFLYQGKRIDVFFLD